MIEHMTHAVTRAATWPSARARAWLDARVSHPATPERWDVDAGLQRRVDDALRAALAPRRAALHAAYLDADELVVVPSLVSPEVTEAMVAELPGLRRARSLMPHVRKAGATGYQELQRRAPTITALYRSSVLKDWCAELAGRPMFYKSDADPHAAAVYFYTRPGDWMDYHYDGCGCEDNVSYSLIIGLEDRSQQQFLAVVRRGTAAESHLCVTTRPGTGIVFCGSKTWHGVSRLGVGEQRTVLSLSYTTGVPMRRGAQFSENVKDALMYFGPSALFARHH